MTEPPFEAVRLAELEPIPVSETLAWKPVRRRLGIRAFGVNAYTAANAGDEVVEDHDETGGGAGGHEELYVVLSGHADFRVGGEAIDAPAGTLVFIRDPAVRRHAVAREAGTTVLAVGGAPGQPFEVSPWESYFAAIPHVKAGDYDRAVELVAEGLREHPDHPSILYNLACYESLAGRREDAIEHLRRATELDPKVLDWAESDSDLDAIRDDPAFPRA